MKRVWTLPSGATLTWHGRDDETEPPPGLPLDGAVEVETAPDPEPVPEPSEE